MKVIFSPEARACLTDIVEYYKQKGYAKKGRKIKAPIALKALKLKDFPRLGPVEGKVTTEDLEYKFLVEGNHKIIYFILEDHVLITDIFDTRQDPEKM